MPRILLTHPPEALRNYYGERVLAGLQALPVTELVPGFLVDLSRGVSRSTTEYHAGQMPLAELLRQSDYVVPLAVATADHWSRRALLRP